MRWVGILCLFLAACQLLKKKEEDAGAPAAPATTASAAPTAKASASEEPDEPEEPKPKTKDKPSAGKVGIKACDDFLADYACHLKKTSPVAAKQMISNLQTAWAQGASNEVSKPIIEQACRSMATAQKSDMKKSGCLKATLEDDDLEEDDDPKKEEEDDKASKKGTCKRASCNLGTEYCCEYPGKDEYQCVARSAKNGKGARCFAHDNHFVVAMECNQFTGCAGGKRCCKNNLAGFSNFTRSVCADTCDVAEVCIAAGACKDGQTCKTDPSERTGGICVGAAKPNRPKTTVVGVDPQTLECPKGYFGFARTGCKKYCTSEDQCGTEETCRVVDANNLKGCLPK
jgi:hypothetical protein